MSTEAVIDIQGLTKRYGTTTALDGLDLHVRRGEVHGFLGPNGAGKTTTLARDARHACAPTPAQSVVLGLDPWSRRHRAALPACLRARRRRALAEPHRRRGHRPASGGCRAATTALGVTSCSSCSSSTRRRSHGRTPRATGRRSRSLPRSPRDAELFLLDEPTSGLDPLMEETFRGYITRLRGRRRTVLLSSHVLSRGRAALRPDQHHPRGPDRGDGPPLDMRHLQRITVMAETEHELHGIDDIAGLHDVRLRRERTCTAPSSPGRLDELLRTSPLQAIVPSRAARRRSSSCSSATTSRGPRGAPDE